MDKDAVSAKCMTMHTECSDSEFDGEALDVDSIGACDSTTLVAAKAHSMNNADIYSKYISKKSDVHQKLNSLIEGHPESEVFANLNTKSSRHGSSGHVMTVTLWAALCVAAAVMLLAVAFYRKSSTLPMAKWNHSLNVSAERQPLISLH